MSERSAAIARTLALLSHARRSRQRARALVKDRTLQTLVSDLVAARTAAGMTQHEVAMRMWTTKSAVSRLESGGYKGKKDLTLAARRNLGCDNSAEQQIQNAEDEQPFAHVVGELALLLQRLAG